MSTNYHEKSIVNHAAELVKEIERLSAELVKLKTPHGTAHEYVEVPFLKYTYNLKADAWSNDRRWANAQADYKAALEIAARNDAAKAANDLLASNLAKMIEACGLKCEVVDRSWRTGKIKSRTPTEWKSALTAAFPRPYGTTDEVESKWKRLSEQQDKIEKQRQQEAEQAEAARLNDERERKLTAAVVDAAKYLGIDPITSDAEHVIETLRERDKYLDLAIAMSATRGDWSDGFYRVKHALGRFKVETEIDKAIFSDVSSCMDHDDGRVFRDTEWNYDRLFGYANQDAVRHYNQIIEFGGSRSLI